MPHDKSKKYKSSHSERSSSPPNEAYSSESKSAAAGAFTKTRPRKPPTKKT